MRAVYPASLAVALLVTLAACGTRRGAESGGAGGTGGGGAMTSPSAAASPAPATSTPAPSPKTPEPAATGVVWPIEVRNLPGTNGQAVLRSISTGRHETYERLVLTFAGAYGAVTVHYVPVVRADPSDRVVRLQGDAYLQVTVHGAVARWGGPQRPYAGPETVTPGYPTLRQARISGDYEAVLSVGVGLDRVAGFRVFRLTGPDRLVVDVAERPGWRMWPDSSPAAARAVQASFEQGHLPWRGDPVAVARLYAQQVYGWSHPLVTKASDGWYRLSTDVSPDSVRVRVAWPHSATTAHSICEIADTR